MAFNINAHVILSGPKNLKAVQKKIQSGLQGTTASVNIKIPKNLGKQLGSFNKGLLALNRNITTLQSSATSANTHLSKMSQQFSAMNKSSMAMSKSQSSVQNSLDKTGKQVGAVRNEIQAFGKDAALAIRRFSAFTVATGVVFGFVRAIQTATKEAIAYEREITKVVQVTGAGAQSLGRLNQTITQLSVSLGVDANKLAELARIFSQTGQTVDQVRDSLRAVARSSLAPSFGEMKNTAEGLIAALAQFNIAAKDSEAILASINAVSKRFAVEAEDLISVIRRAGGVFSQAAGSFDDPKKSLNELIGIFTAVRSTTRESADTIAVGLRTIFTRIQRRGTIEFLKQFNIELIDAKGNFIGLFPAFQQLSQGIGQLAREGDALTLSKITEELGGIRQVGKLIPAITNFNKALAATKIAGEAAAEGLGKDVALALQPLGKRFELLQSRFSALIRDLSQSRTFQNLAKVALSVANAFLSVAETLKPLLPLITTFAAVKLSKGLFEFGKGFVGGFSKGGGAAGAGETLGGGISGGAARERRVADTGAQQALTAAVKSNTTIMGTNTTALQGVTSALQGMGNTITNTTTQMLGAVGNLINALNRGAALGSIRPKKFAKGGPVTGPSHAQGGVPAILEGGEYVVPKGYDKGGTVVLQATSKARKEYGAFILQQASGQIAGGRQGQTVDNPNAFKNLQGKINAQKLSSKGPKGTSSAPPIGNFGLTPAGRLQKDFQQFLVGKKTSGKPNIDWQSNKYQNRGIKTPFLPKDSVAVYGQLTGAQQTDLRERYRSSAQKQTAGRRLQVGPKGTTFDRIKLRGPFPSFPIGGTGEINTELANTFETVTRDMVADGIKSIKNSPLIKQMQIDPIHLNENSLFDFSSLYEGAAETIEGFLLEGVIGGLTNATIGGGGSTFDFPAPFSDEAKERLEKLFGNDEAIRAVKRADAKRRLATANEGEGKLVNKIGRKMRGSEFDIVKYAAAGGPIFTPKGTDTVPAMLTPGEFVVNKSSAQKIGYGNLGRMNHMSKGGVAAKGNVMQYFSHGGEHFDNPDVRLRSTKTRLLSDPADAQQVADDFMDNLVPALQKRLKKSLPEIVELKDLPGAQAMRQQEVGDAGETMPIAKGGMQGRTGQLGFSTDPRLHERSRADVETVEHEMTHAVDRDLGKARASSGSSSTLTRSEMGLSSQQEGSFQNVVAGAVRGDMVASMNAAGKSAEEIAAAMNSNSQDSLKLHEVFARFIPNLDKELQQILLSTSDVDDGLNTLASSAAEGKADISKLPLAIQEMVHDVQAFGDTLSKGALGAGMAELPFGQGPYDDVVPKAKILSPEPRPSAPAAAAGGGPTPPGGGSPPFDLNHVMEKTDQLADMFASLQDGLGKGIESFDSFEDGVTKVIKVQRTLIDNAVKAGASLEDLAGPVEALLAMEGELQSEVGKQQAKEQAAAPPSRSEAFTAREEKTAALGGPATTEAAVAATAAREAAAAAAAREAATAATAETPTDRGGGESITTAPLELLPPLDPLKIAASAMAAALLAGATETQAVQSAMHAVDSALANTAEGSAFLERREEELAKATAELIEERRKQIKATGVDNEIATELATEQIAKEQGPPETEAKKRGDIARKATTGASSAIGIDLDAMTKKTTVQFDALINTVGSSVSAVGAWTASLAGMDFSSPQAAFASLASLGIAVQQTQQALSGLSGMFPKLTSSIGEMIGVNIASSASETAETATNVAATTSEGVETAANVLSTESELAEAAANTAGTMGGFVSDFKQGALDGLDIFKDKAKGLGKGAKNLFGKIGGSKIGGMAKTLGSKIPGAGLLGKIPSGLSKLGPAIAKMAPMLGKLATGLGVGSIASMLIGPIGNAITDGILGAKVEIAPGVKGRRGVSGGAAGAAGALTEGAQGAAMGAAIGTVLLPGIGTAIGALGGAIIGGLKGFVTGSVAQEEFNAFEALQESSKTLGESFKNLAKLGDAAGPAAIGKINKDIEDTMGNLNKAFEAGKTRRIADHFTSFSGILETGIGGAAGALAVGISNIRSSLGIGQNLDMADVAMSDIGSEGFFASAANFFDKGLAAISGDATGAQGRIKDRARTGSGKIIAESLKSAAEQIGPETFQQLDEALQGLTGRIAGELSALGDTDALETLSQMSTVAPDLGEAETTERVNNSFATLTKTLKDIEGPTGAFSKEINKLVANSLKMHLIKDVAEELKILEKVNPKAATDLAIAYDDLNNKVDFSTASVEDIENAIGELGLTGDVEKKMRKLIDARKTEAVETVQQAAVTRLAADAAREARKAIDALAAGLDQFSSKMSGIAGQAATLAGQLESEFAQITGDKLVGKLDQFNPFENVAAASDEQIDAGISQLKGLGSGAEGDTAFREMGGLIKAQRDLPAVMKGVLDKLVLGRDPGETISNVEVQEALVKGLEDADIELPPNVMTTLLETVGSGVQNRQGEDVFSIDSLKKMFAGEGDILTLLGNASEKAATALGQSFNALQTFKNSLLQVADIQQKIAKHRLEGELSMLDKQESIRDRINNALGKTPDTLQQATGDLQNRLSTLVKAGVTEGGTPLAGNVLDPSVLFDRLQGLEGKRDERRKDLGLKPGQTILQQMGGGDASKLTKEMKDNSTELQKLNSEINGTEAALRELANDTRILAAIEGKIAGQQEREAKSKGTVGTLLDALNRLQKGELSREDFNKQFAKPLDSMEKLGAGQDIDFDSAVDLIQRLEGGDQLVAGRFQTKARQIAEQQGRGGDEGFIKEIMANMINNLRTSAGATAVGTLRAGGMGGTADILQEELMQIVEAQGAQQNLGDIMQSVGDAQVNILGQTMDRQQKQLQVMLQTAEKGFQKAALDFQAAVTEFAIMRGGVDAGDVTKREAEVSTAQTVVTATTAQLKKARQAKEAGFGTAGAAAAEEVSKAGGDDAAQAKARIAAIEAEAQANARLIADLERQLELDTQILARKKSILKTTKEALATQPTAKEKKETADVSQEEAARAAGVPVAATVVDRRAARKQLGTSQKELEQLSLKELQERAGTAGVEISGSSKWVGGQGGHAVPTVKNKEELIKDIQRAELEKEAKGLGVSPTTTSQVAAEAGWFGTGAETRESKKAKTTPRLQEDVLRKQKENEEKKAAAKPADAAKAAEKPAEKAAEKGAEKAAEKKQEKPAPVSLVPGTAPLETTMADTGEVPEVLGSASDTAQEAATKEVVAENVFIVSELQKLNGTAIGILAALSGGGGAAIATARAVPNAVDARAKAATAEQEKELQEARARDQGATTGSMDVRSQVGSATQMGQPSAQKEALKEKIKQQVEEQKGTDPFAFANLPEEVKKEKNLGAAEVSMGKKDIIGRSAEFMKAARLSPDKGIRGFARGGGGGIGGVAPPTQVPKKTREERVADNIAKGEAKLKKLQEQGGAGSVWKQEEKLENMKALQAKLKTPKQEPFQKIGVGIDPLEGDDQKMPAGAVQPAAAAQQQKDIEAAKEAERKGIGQQKTEQEANLQARKDRKAARQQGGAPGAAPAAGGNVEQVVEALTGKQFAETVQAAFTTGGNYVGEQITKALKTIPAAIDLKAQLGPVTVNLAGGKVLEELQKGILSEMRNAITTAIQARFNPDGSVKDPSTQSMVPRGAAGTVGGAKGETML